MENSPEIPTTVTKTVSVQELMQVISKNRPSKCPDHDCDCDCLNGPIIIDMLPISITNNLPEGHPLCTPCPIPCPEHIVQNRPELKTTTCPPTSASSDNCKPEFKTTTCSPTSTDNCKTELKTTTYPVSTSNCESKTTCGESPCSTKLPLPVRSIPIQPVQTVRTGLTDMRAGNCPPTFTGVTGPRGPKVPTGPVGVTGPQGPKGVTGFSSFERSSSFQIPLGTKLDIAPPLLYLLTSYLEDLNSETDSLLNSLAGSQKLLAYRLQEMELLEKYNYDISCFLVNQKNSDKKFINFLKNWPADFSKREPGLKDLINSVVEFPEILLALAANVDARILVRDNIFGFHVPVSEIKEIIDWAFFRVSNDYSLVDLISKFLSDAVLDLTQENINVFFSEIKVKISVKYPDEITGITDLLDLISVYQEYAGKDREIKDVIVTTLRKLTPSWKGIKLDKKQFIEQLEHYKNNSLAVTVSKADLAERLNAVKSNN